MPYRKPKHGWTCFHCGETMRSALAAREHFGRTQASQPACLIKAGAEGSLLTALRRAEADLAEAWGIIHSESSEAQSALAEAHSRHADQLRIAEELGYERGLRDGLALPPAEREKIDEPTACTGAAGGR